MDVIALQQPTSMQCVYTCEHCVHSMLQATACFQSGGQKKQVLPNERYEKLSGKEQFLLRRGNALLKAGDLEGAYMYFKTGNDLNPELEEFQFALFVATEKLSKAK